MPVKIDYSEEAMEGGDLRADSTGDWEKLKTTDQLSQMAGRYVLTTLNCAKFRCNHTNFFQTYTVTEVSRTGHLHLKDDIGGGYDGPVGC